jgi:hypothetical protein
VLPPKEVHLSWKTSSNIGNNKSFVYDLNKERAETCGEGVQNNHRNMFYEQFGGIPCEGEESEVVACNLVACPVCPPAKSPYCETYININGAMCDYGWFTDPNGRYSCQEACGLC